MHYIGNGAYTFSLMDFASGIFSNGIMESGKLAEMAMATKQEEYYYFLTRHFKRQKRSNAIANKNLKKPLGAAKEKRL